MSVFTELKRRGVFQAGLAYVLFAWLLVQVADIILPTFEAPAWAMKALILVLLAGFPIAVLVAWFFDLTTRGVRRTKDAETDISIRDFPGHLVNYVIISLLAAAVLLFAMDKFYWKTDWNASPNADQLSIAVLPFSNLTGDAGNEPFAAGIHDTLLTQLSKISAFRVLSRTSMLSYQDTRLPIPEIGRQLGATTILEGGVQRNADRIRINAQLIDARTDTHLWAETYDRQLTVENIFAIQSEISLAIADALRATLTSSEQQAIAQVPTRNLAAYEAYSKARASMDSISANDIGHAIERFSEATRLDPGFASAWAGLCVAQLALYGKDSDRQYFDAAEDACNRALALDNSAVEVHIALGTLYRYFGQYSRAEDALQQANYIKARESLEYALSLDEMQADALIELGLVLARQGRVPEAESRLKKAASLEPGSWSAQAALFSFYYTYSDQPGRFELAAEHARRGATLRPDLASSWNNLGAANYFLGRYELAAEAWQQSLDIEPTRTAYTNTGLAYYYSGDYQRAAELQQKAIELAPGDHRAMGRLADALRYIEGAEDRSLESYRQAARLAQQLLEINQQDWRTLSLLAVYQANLGEDQAAQGTLQRALQFSNRNAETLYNQALVDVRAGRINASLAALEEAVSRDPEYRGLIRRDPGFAPLATQERFAQITSTPAG